MMSEDTEEYVSELQAVQGDDPEAPQSATPADTDKYVSELRAAQGGKDEFSA